MSKSYPFMWISRHHGVPYDVVLLGAQFLRRDDPDDQNMNPHEKRASNYVKAMDDLERIDLINDVQTANEEFRRIQKEGWD